MTREVDLVQLTQDELLPPPHIAFLSRQGFAQRETLVDTDGGKVVRWTLRLD